MKFDAVTLLTLVTVVTTEFTFIEDLSDLDLEDTGNITAYGYHDKIGIPLAMKIRKAEDIARSSNMVLVSHGYIAHLGELPFQVSFLIIIIIYYSHTKHTSTNSDGYFKNSLSTGWHPCRLNNWS